MVKESRLLRIICEENQEHENCEKNCKDGRWCYDSKACKTKRVMMIMAAVVQPAEMSSLADDKMDVTG